MNTQIYLWVDPLIINHKKGGKKIYFNCIIEGEYADKEPKELEDLIGGSTMTEIMDFANIEANFNYGVVSANLTQKKCGIEYAESVEETERKKIEKQEALRVKKILNNKKELELTNKNVKIKDDGIVSVNLPLLNVTQDVDFKHIWKSIEENIIGKIQEGDEVEMKDNDGNVLFKIVGGSYLNVGLAQMLIYDKKSMAKNRSILNSGQGQKGGAYIRKDGSIDIGDVDRTFFMTIYTNRLLKSSLKSNMLLNDMLKNKLLLEDKNPK